MLYKFCKYWLISTSNYLKRNFFNLITLLSIKVFSSRKMWKETKYCDVVSYIV